MLMVARSAAALSASTRPPPPVRARATPRWCWPVQDHVAEANGARGELFPEPGHAGRRVVGNHDARQRSVIGGA